LRVAVGLALHLLSVRAAFRLHSDLVWLLRNAALREWRPRPLDVVTTLFRPDGEYGSVTYDDWSTMCTRLSVVRVAGDHASMLDPPHVERFCDRFIDAVARADAALEPLAQSA
ncbi:MAG: hypothetical protein JO021_07415, partial [Alphaproteobacteria bacterium]|nr:hypothetical protein [Alphaproteobacteria bacterium]